MENNKSNQTILKTRESCLILLCKFCNKESLSITETNNEVNKVRVCKVCGQISSILDETYKFELNAFHMFPNFVSNCFHNKQKSILVGCEYGEVLDFNPYSMTSCDIHTIGSENGQIKKILSINNQIILGKYYDKVSVWKDRSFKNLDFYLQTRHPLDIIKLKDNLIAVAFYNPHHYQVIDLTSNRVIYNYNFDVILTSLCKGNDHSVLLGCYDGWIRKWDLMNNKLVEISDVHSGENISCIINTGSQEMFASTGYDSMLRIWSLEGKSKNYSTFIIKNTCQVKVVQDDWSKMKKLRDGRIAFCTANYILSLLDIRSMSNVSLISHKNCIYDYFQLNDNLLLSCSFDKTIKKWDLRKYDVPCETFKNNHRIYCFESN